MKNRAFQGTRRGTLLCSLLLALMVLSGCSYVGRSIGEDARISLGSGAGGQGSFQESGLTVDYSYRLAGDGLDISGKVAYRLRVESLNVYLLFVDGRGEVVSQHLVYSSGYAMAWDWGRERTFAERLTVPDGAAAFTFTSSAILYRGRR